MLIDPDKKRDAKKWLADNKKKILFLSFKQRELL